MSELRILWVEGRKINPKKIMIDINHLIRKDLIKRGLCELEDHRAELIALIQLKQRPRLQLKISL